MTKPREIYRCPVCGNIVEVLHGGATMSCCGRPMVLLEANTTDGAYEKHVPIVERIEGGFRVRVGSVDHPMADDHYIQWIELLTPTCVLRHELHPRDKPEAVFLIDESTACGCRLEQQDTLNVSAREYCNLHGLWSANVKK